MNRYAVRFTLTLALLGYLTWFSTGCRFNSPTDATYPVPQASLVVMPADAAEQAIAETWWTKQAACVGVPERKLGYKFPVHVFPNALDCGGVSAAGCMRYTEIDVVERWFEMAIAHEWIHFALWKKGGEDIGHSNPAFARCDPNYIAPNAGTTPEHSLLYSDHAVLTEGVY